MHDSGIQNIRGSEHRGDRCLVEETEAHVLIGLLLLLLLLLSGGGSSGTTTSGGGGGTSTTGGNGGELGGTLGDQLRVKLVLALVNHGALYCKN